MSAASWRRKYSGARWRFSRRTCKTGSGLCWPEPSFPVRPRSGTGRSSEPFLHRGQDRLAASAKATSSRKAAWPRRATEKRSTVAGLAHTSANALGDGAAFVEGSSWVNEALTSKSKEAAMTTLEPDTEREGSQPEPEPEQPDTMPEGEPGITAPEPDTLPEEPDIAPPEP